MGNASLRPSNDKQLCGFNDKGELHRCACINELRKIDTRFTLGGLDDFRRKTPPPDGRFRGKTWRVLDVYRTQCFFLVFRPWSMRSHVADRRWIVIVARVQNDGL